MTTQRRDPYIWTTWIARLIAGEVSCTWAPWFKAHHSDYDKLPSTFDQARWNADHTDLLRTATALLRTDGYDVRLEDQNAFRARGANGVLLAGKPDIIAIRGDEALVEDCKTGTPKASDIVQVQTYLALFPFIRPAYRTLRPEGRLRYRDHLLDVPTASVDDTFRVRLRETITRVSGVQAPGQVPSPRECGWCDIGPKDCHVRLDPAAIAVVGGHNLF